MSRLFLVGMSGPKSLQDLRELIDPIRGCFDGVIWCLHDSRDTWEHSYLEEVKGAGAVIHLPFTMRHSFSRNHYLWAGPAEEGAWLCQVDCLERVNLAFAAQIPAFTQNLERNGINTVFYYNKAFLYQQHESLEFVGSPHEGLQRRDGQMHAVELSRYYPTETDIRYSVRAEKRLDPKGWITHYLRYYVEYPFGSNHCLLGNSDRGDEMAIFQQREAMRIEFRDELRRRRVGLTVDALKEYWIKMPLDPVMKRYVNAEKILNDGYRHFALNDLTTIDEHMWTSLKVIA